MERLKVFAEPSNGVSFMAREYKKTILIVDDDESVRRIYREVFTKEGFSVLSASDGLEGLDVAIRENPDLIFTGIIMPRMDGFEMIRNLKRNVKTAQIPILMFSHLGREEDKRRAQDLGVQDFVVRSLTTPHQVAERVKMLLGAVKEYFLEFNATAQDAAKLAREMDFPPYFECSKGGKMILKLVPFGMEGEKKVFRATFICPDEKK